VLRNAGVVGQRWLDADARVPKPDRWLLVPWAEPVGVAARRGLRHARVRRRPRLGQPPRDHPGGRSASERCPPRERPRVWGGGGGGAGWWGGTVVGGTPRLFDACVRWFPGRQGGIWPVPRAADRPGDQRGHQPPEDQALPRERPATRSDLGADGL
jgi:hypothetical protein